MGNIYIHTDILMRKILRKGWSFVLMETLETHLCNRRQCHLSKAMTPVIILLWTVKL